MRACLEVDLKALKHNVKILFQEAGTGFFCPIIKANAYGHGVLEVAKTLCEVGVKQVGVVSIDEALQLKELSQEMRIYILGPFYKDQIPWLKLYGFIPIVGQWIDLKALAELAREGGSAVSFHLKFNTGMNRFGFLPSEKEEVLNYIQKQPCLKLSGLSSHLSEGEQAGSQKKGSAFQQIQKFQKVCEFFNHSLPQTNIDIHLLNSAGWFALWCHGLTKDINQAHFEKSVALENFPSGHLNRKRESTKKISINLGFRPGISLYGIKPPVDFLSPKARERYHSLDLRPVAGLKSFVVGAYTVQPNQRVSYGGRWRSPKRSTLAVISMGYADGLPYRLYKKGEVLFRGKRASIAGHICMDFFMIDVSQQAREGEIKKGEEVVIFGSQKKGFISVTEQTEKAGSIPEEFLTRIGPRVQKLYKY